MWGYGRFDGIDTSSGGSEGATPRAEAVAAPPASRPIDSSRPVEGAHAEPSLPGATAMTVVET
eukprot:3634298-Alexandrium_andersonii.AAC.1